MLDVADGQVLRRLHRERVSWAIFCGFAAAWLVVSPARFALQGHGAFSWLALVWVFEVVFGMTVMLMWSWCHEHDFTPGDPQLSDRAFEQSWADDLRPDRRLLGPRSVM
jgi:hypothetical protein